MRRIHSTSDSNDSNDANVLRGIARPKRRGALTVEFALTLPLFIMLMLASFEFSWLYLIRHTMDNAAYEAARHAMVPGATSAEAIAKARTILRAVKARNATVTVTPNVLDDSVTTVTVRISLPFDQNALLLPRFARGVTLRTSSTLKTERYNVGT